VPISTHFEVMDINNSEALIAALLPKLVEAVKQQTEHAHGSSLASASTSTHAGQSIYVP